MRYRKRARSSVTFLGCICDRSDLQACLPQIVYTNKHVVSHRLMTEVLASTPSNFHIVRDKTGWTTAEKISFLLERIADALSTRPVQIIVTFDTAAQHLHSSVTQTAKRRNIFLLPVPAKTTPILQVLDVFAFWSFKQFLGSENRRCHAMKGYLSKKDCLQNLIRACASVLCGKSWQVAFARLGISSSPTHLTEHLLKLFPEGPPTISEECLSLQQMRSVFPSRYKLHRLRWLPVEGAECRFCLVSCF